MKRILIAAAIVIIVNLCTKTVSAAETPTPIPTSAGTKAIDAGVLNQLLDNSKDYSIDGTEPDPKTKVYIKNVDLTAGQDFKVPNLKDVATFFTNGIKYLTPYTVKQKTIDQEQNLYISGKATYCKTDINNHLVKKPSTSAYTTEVIPELSLLDQASRFAAAITSKYSLSQTDGEYNYNTDREPLVMDVKDSLECDITGNGTIQDSKTVKTTTNFSNPGGWLELLKSIFGSSGIIKATLSSKQLTPYAESMDCLITGCSSGDDISYLSPEEQKRVQGNGGIVKTYAPPSHNITNGETNGQQANTFQTGEDGGTVTLDTNTSGTKAIENATNYMKCAILPKSVRDKFGLAGKCGQNTTSGDSCNSGLPDLSKVQSDCKLCNAQSLISSGNLLTGFEKSSVPNGLPTLAVQILEAAGSFYHVPASVLLGTMLNEGSFEHPGTWQWTDENVKEWSKCGGKMPSCDAFANKASGAKGAFGFLTSDWNTFKGAAHEFDATRPEGQADPCNFFDAAFASAKEIYQDASHLYVDQTRYGMPPDSCLGIGIYKGRDRPTSCSAWTPERVAITRWQYADRICDRQIPSMVGFFNTFKCQ